MPWDKIIAGCVILAALYGFLTVIGVPILIFLKLLGFCVSAAMIGFIVFCAIKIVSGPDEDWF